MHASNNMSTSNATVATLTIEHLKAIVTEAVTVGLAPIEQRISKLEDRLVNVEDRLVSVEDRLVNVEDRVNVMGSAVSIMVSKQANSFKSATEMLQVVPLADGKLPTVDYPKVFAALLAGGAESFPDVPREHLDWSMEKSRALIEQYDPNWLQHVMAAQPGSPRAMSRQLGCKVAECVGVSKMQLTFAQMEL